MKPEQTFFEDPALEVHVARSPAANGQRDLTFAFVTHFGAEGFDQRGVFGVSYSREYPTADADPACRPARPRSTTLTGETPPPTITPPGMPPSTPAGPLSSPWKWEWKVAWDIIPAGALGSIANLGLGAFFALFGLGGT